MKHPKFGNLRFAFYTKKILSLLDQPRFCAILTKEQANKLGYRFVCAKEQDHHQGVKIAFYLFVNQQEGIIEKVSYQAFGSPLLIAILEAFSEMIEKKNYRQASRIGADLIENKLRDSPYEQALDKESERLLNLALSTFQEATYQCMDIDLAEGSIQTPISHLGSSSNSIHFESWSIYSHQEKLKVISDVIKVEIEPYVALDEGGVEVKELIDDKQVVIKYLGSCTSCFSATGATLNAIDQVLKQKVHPNLYVTADPSVLQF